MVVAAVVVGVGAVAGSAIAAHGAKSAANTQAEAADRAAATGAANAKLAADTRVDSIKQSTDEQLGGLNESHRIGNETIGKAQATQIGAINSSTDQLIAGAQQAQGVYEDALKTGTQQQIATAKQVMDAKVAAAQQAAAVQTAARSAASNSFDTSIDKANTTLKDMYTTNKGMYQPYVDTGLDANAQLKAGIQPGGDFTHRFGEADMVKDGGYNFRLNEGRTTLENSAAARGGLLSGNTIKAVTNYGQNFASNEYDKAYGRFNTDMDTRFTRLSSLAGRGMEATGKVTQLGENLARDQSGNIIIGGKYRADGIAENGVTNAGAIRDVGQYTADNAQSVGNANYNQTMGLGTSRANLITGTAGLNADRTVDLGNVDTAAINAIGRNDQNLAQGSAGIKSDGTLAIGNATADGINGVNTATVDGINARANAIAAAQAATGQIWQNGINRATNTFTNFYTMAQKPKQPG